MTHSAPDPDPRSFTGISPARLHVVNIGTEWKVVKSYFVETCFRRKLYATYSNGTARVRGRIAALLFPEGLALNEDDGTRASAEALKLATRSRLP